MTDFCDEMGMTTLFDNILNNPNDSYSLDELAAMSHRKEYREFVRKHPEYKEVAKRVKSGQKEEKTTSGERKGRRSDSFSFLKNARKCRYYVSSASDDTIFYCTSQIPEKQMTSEGNGEGAELYRNNCSKADKEGVPSSCPYYVDDSEEETMFHMAMLCDNILNDMYNGNFDAQHDLSLQELVEMRTQDVYIKFMKECPEYAEVAKLVAKQ